MTHDTTARTNGRSLLGIFGITVIAIALGTLPRAVFGQSTKSESAIKIGIIGSGNIGSTVGSLWIKAGHPVLFSSRHPDELKTLVDSLGPLARAGTVREALTFGDAVFIGVPYGAYPQLGKDFAAEFTGKIVLDAGNAVLKRDGEIANEARENGIGITSAKYLAGARIVRAFNTMNYRRLANNAHRPAPRMAIPIAGNDKQALAIAQMLVQDAGFDPVLIGALESAKLFAQGGPLYGQDITAQEMQQRLRTLR
jgi:predicted dinucleotide-binding enzyme